MSKIAVSVTTRQEIILKITGTMFNVYTKGGNLYVEYIPSGYSVHMPFSQVSELAEMLTIAAEKLKENGQ